jgi:hypothetical protein
MLSGWTTFMPAAAKNAVMLKGCLEQAALQH